MRAQREERGWSRSHLARQLITAARDAGDEAMPAVDTLRKNIYRWENDEVDNIRPVPAPVLSPPGYQACPLWATI
jgi:hypothetical protein